MARQIRQPKEKDSGLGKISSLVTIAAGVASKNPALVAGGVAGLQGQEGGPGEPLALSDNSQKEALKRRLEQQLNARRQQQNGAFA